MCVWFVGSTERQFISVLGYWLFCDGLSFFDIIDFLLGELNFHDICAVSESTISTHKSWHTVISIFIHIQLLWFIGIIFWQAITAAHSPRIIRNRAHPIELIYFCLFLVGFLMLSRARVAWMEAMCAMCVMFWLAAIATREMWQAARSRSRTQSFFLFQCRPTFDTRCVTGTGYIIRFMSIAYCFGVYATKSELRPAISSRAQIFCQLSYVFISHSVRLVLCVAAETVAIRQSRELRPPSEVIIRTTVWQSCDAWHDNVCRFVGSAKWNGCHWERRHLFPCQLLYKLVRISVPWTNADGRHLRKGKKINKQHWKAQQIDSGAR